jgi:hypothetical protein
MKPFFIICHCGCDKVSVIKTIEDFFNHFTPDCTKRDFGRVYRIMPDEWLDVPEIQLFMKLSL